MMKLLRLKTLLLLGIMVGGVATWAQAPVNTVLWSETWTGGGTEQPSAYNFSGTTVYGNATITYSNSSLNTCLYDANLAGGDAPELLLSKSNQTWTISNIPTGQAKEMALSFLSNKTTFALTSTTSGISISGSQKSWTITNTGNVSTFNLTLKNTGSNNARIDNVELIVTRAGGGGDASNVSAPTFSVAAGAVTAPTTLELIQDDADLIMYTTDGTNPDFENNVGEVYSETDKITITRPCTIKAIAIDADENVSPVASATYTISVTEPSFSLEPGDVEQGTELTITATTGNTIRYTTDGNNPTLESTLYSGPITINNDMTVKAIAVDAYNNTSSVASATYKAIIPGTVTVDIVPNYSFFGKDGQFSGTTFDVISGTKDNVTITCKRNTGSLYANQSAMRFYKDNEMIIEASEGKVIKSITLTMSQVQTDLTSNPTGYDNSNKTWTGSAATVTLSRPSNASSYAQITKITISLADDVQPTVAKPIISLASGTYTEMKTTTITCETEGASIYYTLDGTDPTSGSTLYTGDIAINESCTLKAIAIKDNDLSNIATATYIFTLPLTTIAQIKQETNNSSVFVRLTDAQVVFVSGNDIYVRDATGAIDFYQSGITELANGDIFDATIEATYTLFKGMPELKSFTTKEITKKGNGVIVAKVLSATDAIEDNICDLVKFTSVQLTESNNKYYIDNTDIQLYDKFGAEYTVETGKDADISGVVIPFGNDEPYTYQICPRMSEDIVYLDNSVEVAVGSLGMSTFSCDQALDFTAVDAIYAYIATLDTDGTTINFNRIRKVPANTGLLLRNSSGEKAAVAEINVPILSGDAESVTSNALVAVAETISQLPSENSDNSKNYILFNGTQGIGFYLANNQTVAAGKAYLKVPAGMRAYLNFDGEETAIECLAEVQQLSGQVFDLQGRRVAQPTKGIYIVNGKKVIIK